MIVEAVEKQLDVFIVDLKRKQVKGSYNVAVRTAEFARQVISHSKWSNAKQLLDILREVGSRLVHASPLEFAIGNVVRRIMFFVREEYTALVKKEQNDQAPSLTSMIMVDDEELDFMEPIRELKAAVIEAINEMLDEIKELYRNIASQAIEHIHADEVIMTFGTSRTVLEFLKAAARKRKFQVVVTESAPGFEGHQAALALSAAGIDTTVIPDAAIFAMMARVNKVIIGTHAVVANGGLIAPAGTDMLSIAAQHHAVPLLVCTGLYKLCPLYPQDQDTFNDFTSPAKIIKFEEADDLLDSVQVQNPAFDYIPPERVGLFLTNLGGHNPSYIYRLLAGFYNPEDTLEDSN
eukprot:TRINITY_DN2284_c0_g1_i2.p1 TRINITY_DN2284_c0_g1~~TRINITY_DN2284_c0_g1_i2.p1  ORF type:complete len:349 (-),score=89.90 TRINITY_DN2284_c0_g1_i2:52-1098(-)